MTGGDSSEESDYGTDRSSTFDGPHGWVTRIILAPRQVCQEMGPIQGLEKRRSRQLVLGRRRMVLARVAVCWADRQQSVQCFLTFLFRDLGLVVCLTAGYNLISHCRHDGENHDSFFSQQCCGVSFLQLVDRQQAAVFDFDLSS